MSMLMGGSDRVGEMEWKEDYDYYQHTVCPKDELRELAYEFVSDSRGE